MTQGSDYQRVVQVYNWYRTARLGTLYYEDSLDRWKKMNFAYDSLIALTGASSPLAFWKHSQQPLLQQGWFYLTLIAAVLALFKPLLRWEKKVVLFAELQTHYCDLYMELKFATEDIQAGQKFTSKMETHFEIMRRKFRELERKEPKQSQEKVKLFEDRVNKEIDLRNCWFPKE
jgi:hypothetical protein